MLPYNLISKAFSFFRFPSQGKGPENEAGCHGSRTFKLVLWSIFSRILQQRIKHFLATVIRKEIGKLKFRASALRRSECYKLIEISFFIIFYQNLVEFMTSSLGYFAYFK